MIPATYSQIVQKKTGKEVEGRKMGRRRGANAEMLALGKSGQRGSSLYCSCNLCKFEITGMPLVLNVRVTPLCFIEDLH